MKKFFVSLCMTIGCLGVLADAPTVPNNIQFAGLNLKLNEKARKKIQAEVDALTKSPKYFQVKVDRLQMYFPIIERIFREERLPEDFKYLVLQESALISDAVSSSNAVGYWQFKVDAAREVGLRVDRQVDERLNIVSSTRGAAKYLKKNNSLYFNNWVHALLSYHQGPGGAMKIVNNRYNGVRSMPIDGRTHWYVIKFLAHKIAFEQVKSSSPQYYLVEYFDGGGKTLQEIARETRLENSLVQNYNKWLKRGRVPDDKPYAVILPYAQRPPANLIASSEKESRATRVAARNREESVTNSRSFRTQQHKYPKVYGASRYGYESKQVKINGLPGILVGEHDDLDDLARISGVSVKRLLYYNDIENRRSLKPGEFWYLKSKRSKGREHYHIVEPGETLWSISQKYGIKLSKLRQKNRIGKRQEVREGRVLWLRFIRPADEPVAYQEPYRPADKEPAKKETVSRTPTAKKSTPAVDTARGPKSPSKPVQQGPAATKAQTQDPPAIPEEDEFELDEPVHFVGVDKDENVSVLPQKVHVVQAGETLYSLSKKYGISVLELRELNGMDGSNDLKIGQELKVAAASKEPPATSGVRQDIDNQYIIHEVQPGETLYQIARDYQATIKQIMGWNGKTDFNIAVGEKLKVKKPQ